MTTKIPSILSAIHKLRFLFTPEEKKKWIGITLFALVCSVFEIITASVIVIFAQVLIRPEVIQKYFTYVGFDADLQSSQIILYMALFLGAVYLVKNIVATLEVFYQNFTIQNMACKFKKKLLDRYGELDYGQSLKRNIVHSIQVISGDSDRVFSTGIIAMASFFSEAAVFCCLVGMIIYMNPPLAFIIFGLVGVIGFVVVKYLLPRFYYWGIEMQETTLSSNKHLMAFLCAFKEVILLGKRNVFIDRYQVGAERLAHISALQTATNATPRIALELIFIALFVITIAILCIGNETPAQMMGVLGAYLYAGFRLMPGLNRMINTLNNFKSAIPNIERVYKEYKYLSSVNSYVNVPDFEFKDRITFDNASFAYPSVAKNALTHVSFTIKKGETVGVVGETGSGKSTLIDMLLGLFKPHEGSILVDGKYPVNAYQWHKRIGYVPQSAYLTDDTIEANIAFGEDEIDRNKLNAAIDAAQLRKFIDKLPNGAKTDTGDRGARLSGGERQRIAIARALYHEPEVLVFDEATSALDNETEMRLMETIQKISRNRTVVMIAHRTTTLKNCSRIFVIEDGVMTRETDYTTLQKAA